MLYIYVSQMGSLPHCQGDVRLDLSLHASRTEAWIHLMSQVDGRLTGWLSITNQASLVVFEELGVMPLIVTMIVWSTAPARGLCLTADK